MHFKKYVAAVAAALVMFPALTNAQIVLNDSGKLQLATLTSELVGVFNEISVAQGQGGEQSPAFQAKLAVWVEKLTSIQKRLVELVAVSTVQTVPIQTQTSSGSGNTCPNIYRILGPGDSGSDVAALQLYLAREMHALYEGNVTGYYDDLTVKAVQRYQSYYGLVSSGSPETTGYGRVGPGTRASMAAQCNSTKSITTTAPVTVPANPWTSETPANPATPTTPVKTVYSSGELSLITSLTGQSGGPNSVSFRVNMLPNSSCTSAAFVLDFGDGQKQNLASSASCGNQIQTVAHVYPATGSYNATLTSGNFSTTLVVNIQAPNNSITMSAATDASLSFAMTLTATYNPGVTCVPGSYSIDYGDGSSQSLSYANANCSTQTQVLKHTYPQAGQYLITASDPLGRAVTTTFTATPLTTAGAGDPFQMLSIHADGANNSTTFLDVAKNHPITVGGSAKVDASTYMLGNGSMLLNGASYLSTPASTDFNFDTGPFTIDLWFKPAALPSFNGQAALIVQSASNAADNSLGGAGLEIFGDQLYFVGKIGSTVYHPFYNNAPHSGSLSTGVWYHGAVVRSGNTVTLYLDGKPQGSIGVSGAANISTGGLAIGRYGDFAGNYFNGNIDEIDVAKGIARWTSTFSTSTLVR